MKKILLSLIPILTLSLSSCSGSDSNNSDPNSDPKPEIVLNIKEKIKGVWRQKDLPQFFISFSDGEPYYTAYIDEKTLDDGDYSVKDKTVSISHSYIGYDTKIEITSISDDIMTCKITYMSLNDNPAKENSKTVTFKKTDEAPSVKQNKLIGKIFETFTPYNGGLKLEHTVVAHNFMTFTAKTYSSGIATFSGVVHYVYLPPKILFTRYRDGEIFVYSGISTINAWQVWIENDGSLTLENSTVY